MKEFKFRDGLKPIEVGQEVYIQNVNKSSGIFKVSKIGRTLVHLENETSFYFDGQERSDYSHNSLWSSVEQFELDVEKRKTLEKIRSLIDGYGRVQEKFTAESLTKALEILQEGKNDK